MNEDPLRLHEIYPPVLHIDWFLIDWFIPCVTLFTSDRLIVDIRYKTTLFVTRTPIGLDIFTNL